MEIIDKTAIIKSIYENILEGNFHQAEILEKDNSITTIEIIKIAEKAFKELVKKNQFSLAISISEQYNLPTERRIEAVTAQFRLFNRRGEYEKSIEWGMKYKLPKNEVITVAVKAFDEEVSVGNVEKALKYKNEYLIPYNLIAPTARQAFNIFFEQQKNLYAFLIGQEFDISRKRMLTAGVRAYQQILNDGDIDRFVELEAKFKILGDREIGQIGESDIKYFIKIFKEVVVRELLDKGKADRLAKIVDSLKFVEHRGNNPLLGTMVKQIAEEVSYAHNNIMETGNYPEAFRLVESFHLLSNDISTDAKVKIIETAEKAHHKLIGENNLHGAKIIKDNYNLFGKNIISKSLETVSKVSAEYLGKALSDGDVENAKLAIKEYTIPKDTVWEIASGAIVTLLRSRKYIEAFEVIKELKIDVNEQQLQSEAQASFEESYEKGQFELATNLSFYFKLNDKRAVQAAFILWQKHIKASKYEHAMDMKKRHKIPKKMTDPVVKEIYNTFIVDKKTEQAIAIRHAYKLKPSIWQWIVEFFQKLFKK